MRLAAIVQAVTAFRDGRIGDAAVLKAVALSPASEASVQRAIAKLDDPLTDLAALTARLQPEVGTLGWHYSQFVARNGIEPLRLSPDLAQQIAHGNLVVARYVVLHDTFHVLLGFDISRCGELAVWSFVAAQRYNRAYAVAARLASWFYPLMEPSSLGQLKVHRARGHYMGLRVPCLLAQPIEQLWTTQLDDVRSQLGIDQVGIDKAIQPSQEIRNDDRYPN